MRLPKKLSSAVAFAAGSYLCLLMACKNEKNPSETAPADGGKEAAAMPAIIGYSIANEYPHDPGAFTEGLEFRDGSLYEGTGEYGRSEISKTDLKTGKVLASIKLDPHFFGEGITILNGKIYQLTYREGKGFVYDLNTLKQERSFTINTQEGWGMTNNGTNLIFDDGSNILHYIDPLTFKEIRTLAVTDENGPVNEINEPEMIKGYIYANVWKKDIIVKIDTATGRVVGRADLSGLREQAGIPPVSGRRNAPDVMNGIAYDPSTNRIFITGKNWPKLFEVKLDN
jgi:glutamine cyclotransferase